MTDIFISYSQRDRSRVEALASRLREIGFDVWFDARLRSGASFDEAIAGQLREARTVLAAWTPAAIQSEWVRSEAAMAHKDGRLAACFLEPTELSPPFNLVHAEDLTDWRGEDDHRGWTRLLAELCVRSDRSELKQWGQSIQADDEADLRRWVATAPAGPLRAATRFHLAELPDFSSIAPAPSRRKSNGLRVLLGAGAVLLLGAIAGYLLRGGADAASTPAAPAQDTASATPRETLASVVPQAASPQSMTTAPSAGGTRQTLAPGVEHRLEIQPGGTMDLDAGTSTDRIDEGSDFLITETYTGSESWFVESIAERATITSDAAGTPTRATCGRSSYSTRYYFADPGEYNCFRTSEGRAGVLMRQRNREGFSGVVISYRFWD
jgi:hypothetical protein